MASTRLGIVALAWSLIGSGQALAQEQPPPSPDTKAAVADLQEVTVTGTRILRQDYVAPNPMQTLSQQDLQNLGIVNIADAITQIPANVSTFTPANQGGNAFFVGSTLANLRGLNPYFGTRTLTLVDSKRFVPTNQGESVDLNFIPTIMVDRTEVVTGGSSAVYGSDAIAGVINIVLNKRFSGLKVDADYGATTHGDGKGWHAGALWGTDLFGGTSHLVLGGEYQRTEPIPNCAAAREWCAASNGMLTNWGTGTELAGTPRNPVFQPVIPGAPQHVFVSDITENQFSYNGVIVKYNPLSSAPQTTLQANPAGSGVQSFNVGQFGTLNPFLQSIGGDGRLSNDGASLYPSGDRRTVYAHFSTALSNSITGYVDSSWGEVNGFIPQNQAGLNNTNVCLHADNPYLTGDLAGHGGNYSNNFTTIFFGCNSPFDTYVGKDWSSQIDRYVTNTTKVWRGILGLDGTLGKSWNWSAYYQFGHTSLFQLLNDDPTNQRLTWAMDVVTDNRPGSATFGQPVCRVTRDGVQPTFPGAPVDPNTVLLAKGCQPINVFGTTPLSAAALAYAWGPIIQTNDIQQHVVAASLSGELWKGWGAGPLAAAGGAEYRQETLENGVADLPKYQRVDFFAQYGDAFAGKSKVWEAFLELEMPLLRNLPGAKLLELNAAVRNSHYTNHDEMNASNPDVSENITTYKLAAVWDTSDWLRVRGSWSHDLRAPGMRELFYTLTFPRPVGFQGNTNDPWLTPTPFGPANSFADQIYSGNTGLRPEKSTTSTIGAVLTGLEQSMHFSADYYRIKIVDGIAGGNIGNVITNCANGDQDA
jgi:outer membrane receptor protein involved in Fe transport